MNTYKLETIVEWSTKKFKNRNVTRVFYRRWALNNILEDGTPNFLNFPDRSIDLSIDIDRRNIYVWIEDMDCGFCLPVEWKEDITKIRNLFRLMKNYAHHGESLPTLLSHIAEMIAFAVHQNRY